MAQAWSVGADVAAVDGVHVELQGAPRDVVAVILDPHLVQALLGGGVPHRDGAILVVSDVGPGGLPRGHPHLPVSSPFCTVKGMTRLKGLSMDSMGSAGTTGSSVAQCVG